MNQNHLSTSDIAIYQANSPRSIEIGRHLLVCRECRAKLPLSSPQELLNCLFEDTAHAQSQRPHSIFAVPRFSTFSLARAAAFAGLSFMLVFGLYLIIGDRLAPSETTIASGDQSNVGNLDPVLAQRTESSPPLIDGPPAVEGPVRRNGSTHAKNIVKSDQGKTHRVSSPAPKVRNVEPRGNENPCSNKTTVNLESVSDGEDVVLKWNAVRGAASYDVYIADLDENLIDHFESKSQTSYRTSIILEPAKIYRWKLIITLTNGDRIVVPPQVLELRGIRTNLSKSRAVQKQRSSFEMRCIAAK